MRLIFALTLAAFVPACADAGHAQDQQPTQNTTTPSPPLNPAPTPQAPSNVTTPEQPNAAQPQPVPRNEDNSPAETGDDQPPKS